MSRPSAKARNPIRKGATRLRRSHGLIFGLLFAIGLWAMAVTPALSVSALPGWPCTTGNGVSSSPALADLDGDGSLEVIVGSGDGKVYAWHHDGAVVTGWPQTTGSGVYSSPVLGDLDGDGGLEVVAGSQDGKVYVWRHDGAVVAGWPQTTGDGVGGNGIYSSPAVGDLDGDGRLEVVVGCEDHKLYAWHDNGTVVAGWPQTTGDVICSSPALGDLDGDGSPEVAVGSQDGHVYAWRGSGVAVAGWPQSTGAAAASSPALGDLDGDGHLEVVIGCNDGAVYAWNHAGVSVAGWPQATGAWVVYSSPALGDLDGDGDLEVIVGAEDGRVYAWHHDGAAAAGWPQTTGGAWVDSSPALGDLDGDGDPEVVVGSGDGRVYAWHGDGAPVAGWPQTTTNAVTSSPALGDLNGDGNLEVVVGSDDGGVYAWTCETPTDDLLPWPMFQCTIQRAGRWAKAAALTATAGPDRAIVVGGSTALAGLASQGVAPYTYFWTPATGLSNRNAAQPTASPTTTTTYVLTVRDARLQTATDAMTVTVSASGRITGQVKAGDPASPLVGATVQVRSGDVLCATGVTVAPYGIYDIAAGLPAGTYTVSASRSGYVTQTKTRISINPGATTYVNYLLSRSGVLQGQVTAHGTGSALGSARVDVYLGGVAVASATTGADGAYAIDSDLPTGDYVVTAGKTGYIARTVSNVSITAGATTTLAFALDAICLKGQVRLADTSTNVAGATVCAYLGSTTTPTGGATADANGIYQIGGLESGTYTVVASAPGLVKQGKPGIAFTAGAVTYVNFALRVSGQLKGQVTDRVTARPIVGATIIARTGGVPWATGVTVAPYGVYQIDSDLPAGTYTILCSAPGYQTFGRTGIAITSGALTYVNFTLAPQ